MKESVEVTLAVLVTAVNTLEKTVKEFKAAGKMTAMVEQQTRMDMAALRHTIKLITFLGS